MLSTDTTMTLQSTTGLPTGTGITLVIDATDPVSGLPTPTLKETVTGVVSGSTVTSLLRGLDTTTAQAHASGANVVMWITANLWNDWQTSYLTQHAQLGTHTTVTATSITNSGNYSQTGGTFVVPNNVIGATALATNAIKLGSITPVTSSQLVTSIGSNVAVTGFSLPVTIPAGGRDVEVNIEVPEITCTGATLASFVLWTGSVGGTQIMSWGMKLQDNGDQKILSVAFEHTPAAGSLTYYLSVNTNANDVTINDGATSPGLMWAKAI